MKNSLSQVITTLVFVGATIGIGLLAINTYKNLKIQEIRNEARFQCAQSYRYSKSEQNGVVVSYPMEELYNKCLQEKGV